MKNLNYIMILAFLFSSLISVAKSADEGSIESVDLSDIQMEDLDSDGLEGDFESEMMLFEDIPVVYSVSRSEQAVTDLSVPVTIIDKDDIHYSGITNVADLLKYHPGVDLLPGSRNHYRLSMGGLRYSYYDRNVTLINGRNLNSPINGSTDFLAMPVFMEDIEKIEVVRGSGGAAWGTNAFAGVINIVTKRPEDIEPGFLYSGTINEFGDIYNHLRWANKKDNWQWRMSVGYDDWCSTEDTVSGDNFESRDFSRLYRIDTEAIVELNDLMELSFGAAYSRAKRGDYYQKDLQTFYNPYLPTIPVHERYETSRFFARLERKKYDDYSFHLQWFGNYEVRKEYFNNFARGMENDLEFQVDYDLEKHDLSLGTNFRHFIVDNIYTEHSNNFLSNKYIDYQAGLYVIDRWDIADRLDLEFQARGDYYSDTKESDFSAMAAAIYDLAEEYKQKLRFSVSRAYRSPAYGWKYVTFKTVEANPSMENERVLSFQAGYSIDPSENVKIRLDGHYHNYKDTIGMTITQLDPVYGPLALTPDNNGDLEVLGAQGKVTFDLGKAEIDMWCSYDDIDLKEFEADLVSIMPARVRAGLNCLYSLPENWVLSANYKYSGDPRYSGNADPLCEHSDMTVALTKGFADGNAEIMFGVQNIFSDDYNLYQGIDEIQYTVGRTFFGRLQFRF